MALNHTAITLRVYLDMSINLIVSQFSHLLNGDNDGSPWPLAGVY